MLLDTTASQLKALNALCRLANRKAKRIYGISNTCIVTSAAIVNTLEVYDIPARMMRVSATVYGPTGAVILGAMEGDMGRRSSGSCKGWIGHAAVIVDDRYLVDATLDQVNTTCPGLAATPFVSIVTPEFLAGQESMETTTGKQSAAVVRYRAYPNVRGWLSKPAYRKSQRRTLMSELLSNKW